MALKTCVDCGHDVSSRAVACPGCGQVMNRAVRIDSAGGCAMIAFGVFCGLALFAVLAAIFAAVLGAPLLAL